MCGGSVLQEGGQLWEGVPQGRDVQDCMRPSRHRRARPKKRALVGVETARRLMLSVFGFEDQSAFTFLGRAQL